MLIDLLLISALVVYIVDLSGFTQTMYGIAGHIFGRKVTRLKPLDCSLCMTWWTGLAYLLITGNLTLPMIGYVAALSILSTTIGNIIMLVKDVLDWLISKINRLL